MTLFEQNQICEILLIENCKIWNYFATDYLYIAVKGNWDEFLAESCLHRQTLNKYLEERKKKESQTEQDQKSLTSAFP